MLSNLISVPPTIMELSGGGTVEVRKGTPVTLECRAQGNPTPFYQWTRRVSRIHCVLPDISEFVLFIYKKKLVIRGEIMNK